MVELQFARLGAESSVMKADLSAQHRTKNSVRKVTFFSGFRAQRVAERFPGFSLGYFNLFRELCAQGC
eukprot:168052-Amphidinium_carterae.1